MCNPMHPHYGALSVPVRVTLGAVIADRYTYTPPRCRTSQYRVTFIAMSVSLWNDIGNPVFDGVEPPGFKIEQGQCIFIGLAARSLFTSCCFPFLFFHSVG